MVVFAAIVSVMLACLKRERAGDIVFFASKNFLYMTGGVILAGWLIHFL
jgi:hypothetical protein